MKVKMLYGSVLVGGVIYLGDLILRWYSFKAFVPLVRR